ncbi:MAG TPA: ABC transporter permease [Thermomicrobiales bacterium]|nr:ABC transporter permease [Thermomicrobiales bacterium]
MSIEESVTTTTTPETIGPLTAAEKRARLQEDETWRTRLRKFNRLFFRGKPLNVAGAAIILVFMLMTIFGTMLVQSRGPEYHATAPKCGGTNSCILEKFQGPSARHWFGTDDLGRDVFSRVVAGAKYSLIIAVVILAVAVSIGTLIGAVAGYAGGYVDEILMRVTDMFLAFPALILAIAISASLGPSLRNAVIALAAVYWPWYARLVRAQVLTIRSREFIEAARSSGASDRRVLLRHIIGYAILATSSLSFIGLGAQPPTPEWGRLITDGRNFFRDAWWYISFPGIALSITVLGFNLIGDGLRDYLDPRTKSI